MTHCWKSYALLSETADILPEVQHQVLEKNRGFPYFGFCVLTFSVFASMVNRIWSAFEYMQQTSIADDIFSD